MNELEQRQNVCVKYRPFRSILWGRHWLAEDDPLDTLRTPEVYPGSLFYHLESDSTGWKMEICKSHLVRQCPQAFGYNARQLKERVLSGAGLPPSIQETGLVVEIFERRQRRRANQVKIIRRRGSDITNYSVTHCVNRNLPVNPGFLSSVKGYLDTMFFQLTWRNFGRCPRHLWATINITGE